MIEQTGALTTWRLASPPDEQAVDMPQPARKLAHHRLAYLDYEGPVSGGRGCVARYDRGMCDQTVGADGAVLVTFHGVRIGGRYELRPAGKGCEDWRFTRLSDS